MARSVFVGLAVALLALSLVSADNSPGPGTLHLKSNSSAIIFGQDQSSASSIQYSDQQLSVSHDLNVQGAVSANSLLVAGVNVSLVLKEMHNAVHALKRKVSTLDVQVCLNENPSQCTSQVAQELSFRFERAFANDTSLDGEVVDIVLHPSGDGWNMTLSITGDCESVEASVSITKAIEDWNVNIKVDNCIELGSSSATVRRLLAGDERQDITLVLVVGNSGGGGGSGNCAMNPGRGRRGFSSSCLNDTTLFFVSRTGSDFQTKNFEQWDLEPNGNMAFSEWDFDSGKGGWGQQGFDPNQGNWTVDNAGSVGNLVLSLPGGVNSYTIKPVCGSTDDYTLVHRFFTGNAGLDVAMLPTSGTNVQFASAMFTDWDKARQEYETGLDSLGSDGAMPLGRFGCCCSAPNPPLLSQYQVHAVDGQHLNCQNPDAWMAPAKYICPTRAVNAYLP